MKYTLVLLFFVLQLFSQDNIQDTDEAFIVEDTSGLTKDEIREKAKIVEEKQNKNEELNSAIDSMLNGTFNEDIDKEKTWEELSPEVKNYDWIQTKSGEWFKGYIKAMFDQRLDFDSDEIGIRSFKFKDIQQIKSYQIIGVNINKIAIFEGIIRLKGDKIIIVQGNNKFEFKKSNIVSFAPIGTSESDKWYLKFSISADWRSGNINQTDYSAQGTIQRRTAKSRLVFDYLGRYSIRDGVTTVNDERLNEKFDLYFSKSFYWTPIFGEYYEDNFKNIDQQITAGAGIGYLAIDTETREWDLTAGIGLLFTKYLSVKVDEDKEVRAYSFELGTLYKDELTKNIDFTYSYNFSLTGRSSGLYKHHMLAKVETDITRWLDLDVTYVWDYIKEPKISSTGIIPKRDDFQVLVGIGVEY